MHANNSSSPHRYGPEREIQVAHSGEPLRAFSLPLMRLFNGLLWAPERLLWRGAGGGAA